MVEPKVRSADMRQCDDVLANPQPRSSQTFRRPVEGVIVSKFGLRSDRSINDGIDFAVPIGTPVKAAENGVVAYVGNEIQGLGQLVLIRHADDYVSAYAHNSEFLVKRCDIVKRGQVIAKSGNSGSVSKPQLHFELRKNSRPVDPTQLFASIEEVPVTAPVEHLPDIAGKKAAEKPRNEPQHKKRTRQHLRAEHADTPFGTKIDGWPWMEGPDQRHLRRIDERTFAAQDRVNSRHPKKGGRQPFTTQSVFFSPN